MALASQTTNTIPSPLSTTVTKPFSTTPDVTDIESECLELPAVDEKSLSTSISKTWTDQAVKCHITKADCANCSVMRGNYSFTCQMNKVVPILLEVLGTPDPDRVEKIRPYAYD